MSVFGLVLMLAGVLCMAGSSVLQRYLLREKICSQYDVLVWGFVIAGSMLGIASLWWPGVGLSESDLRVFWVAVAATTAANVVIQYANNKARAIADVSLTAPIQGMTPLLIAGAAVTLNEWPTRIGVAGIVLIALGMWIHTREKATTILEYLLPLRMLWLPSNFSTLSAHEQKQAQNDTLAIRWSYASACFGTIGLLFDGIATRNGSVALGWCIDLLILAFIFSIAMRPERTDRELRDHLHWLGLSAYSALWAGHVLLIMSVFRFAPVAYVGSLKRLSILATVFLAYVLINEYKAGWRMFPAGMIAFGAMLLFFDPGSSAIVAKADNFLRVWVH